VNKIINFLFRRNSSSGQDLVRKKIEGMLAAGQSLHLNKEEQLSVEDVKFLNNELKKRSLLIAIVFLSLGIIFSLLGEGGSRLIGYAAFALIVPVVWYQQKEMKRVISDGKKQIIRGIITKKFTTGSNRKDSSITYHLTLGDVNLSVKKNCYDCYMEGEAAEFHTVEYPKRITFVISHQKIIGAGLR